ncbi:hypothetical protein AC1031_002183 [Aphanomyces cochlioides]|nr:hypothetical protein AC1031_002183 [Aphanomyces cochlioides]
MQREMSYWEKAARVQLFQKQKAIQENEQLREATKENSAFIAKMKTFLLKKPRLDAESKVDEWQQYKLAATACLRAAGIHAIADRQYDRLDSALINAGLKGLKENYSSVRPTIKNAGKTLFVEIIRRIKLDAPRSAIANAAWAVFIDPQKQIPVPIDAQRSIEMLDSSTMYEMFQERTTDGVVCHSNFIRKVYDEEGRHVILSRTVLHDALAPQMIHGDVEDESVWIVVEADERNPNQCFFTFLHHSQIDLNGISITKPFDVNHLAVRLAQRKADGQELVPINDDGIEWAELPPALAIFSRNGRIFISHLEQAISSAIASYHASKTTSKQ